MSRVAKNPINIPDNVELKINENIVMVKGGKGELEFELPLSVNLNIEENILTVQYDEADQKSVALAGTSTGADIKSSFSNTLITSFEFKLALRGFFSTIIFLIISPGGLVMRFEIGKTPLNLLFLLTTNKLSVDNGILFFILRYRITSSTE